MAEKFTQENLTPTASLDQYINRIISEEKTDKVSALCSILYGAESSKASKQIKKAAIGELVRHTEKQLKVELTEPEVKILAERVGNIKAAISDVGLPVGLSISYLTSLEALLDSVTNIET